MALASVLLEERAAFHFDALRPLLNAANPQVGDAITSLEAELHASGVNAGAADALATRQLGSALWATSQLLAFRDCFLTLGLGFLALAPIAIMLPGRVPKREIG